ANDSHLHHDVVETFRPQARKARHLRAALHLEQSDRVGLLQRVVYERIVGGQVRQIDVFVVSVFDEVDAVLQHSHHAETEQVDLMMPISAQSSLSHWTTTRPGMVAGSSGTMESSW